MWFLFSCLGTSSTKSTSGCLKGSPLKAQVPLYSLYSSGRTHFIKQSAPAPLR